MSDLKVRISHGDRTFHAKGDASLVEKLYRVFLGGDHHVVTGPSAPTSETLEDQIAKLDPSALNFLSESVAARRGVAPAPVAVPSVPELEDDKPAKRKNVTKPKAVITVEGRSLAQRLYEQTTPLLPVSEVARRTGLGSAQINGLAMSGRWHNPRKSSLASASESSVRDDLEDDTPEDIDRHSDRSGDGSLEDEANSFATSHESLD